MAELPQIKAVSNRNNFTPIEQLAEMYSSDDQGRQLLLRFARSLLHEIANAYEVATKSAIHQATELLWDPNYTERRKKLSTEQRKRDVAERDAKKKQEILESIDPEQIVKKKARELRYIEDHIAYHKRGLAEFEAKRVALVDGKQSPQSQIWDQASRA